MERRSQSQPLVPPFSTVLLESPSQSGWTYVVLPRAPELAEARGLVKVRGSIDTYPFTSAFVALGEGAHKLPVPAAVGRAIGKAAGDTVTIRLTERFG
ncbi:MAG TPA: DUF1905 domain-containing protein [Acidimicrobiales bacterium]|nr:DUF1905 domain-containing protein [Acidimicrobiales bacterium]